jgi:hypothetical protein
MARPIINTHAGDDSDGKIWGIEGLNILIILAGLLLSVGLTLLLFRQATSTNAFCLVVGSLPLSITCGYVFGFRQGKPKAYDTDQLETLVSGTGWMPPIHQPRHPLYRHEGS